MCKFITLCLMYKVVGSVVLVGFFRSVGWISKCYCYYRAYELSYLFISLIYYFNKDLIFKFKNIVNLTLFNSADIFLLDIVLFIYYLLIILYTSCSNAY